MYTTQSKMISRAIWVEKKHVWKINLQKNGVRKSFYSSVPGDKGRKICAQNATSWLSGACPSLILRRMSCDIPLAQSTKITLATGFTRS